MARCELLTTWGISTTGNFLHETLRYNDILCIIFDYDLFSISYYDICERKEWYIFLGVVFWLYLFYFLIFLSTCTTTSALGTCGLGTKTRYTEFCRLFLSFCPFLMPIPVHLFGFMPLCLVSSLSSIFLVLCLERLCQRIVFFVLFCSFVFGTQTCPNPWCSWWPVL